MKKENAFFWPRLFYGSLPKQERKLIPVGLVEELQQANQHLWRALNIYDDFLDGTGVARRLSVANDHFRKFLEIYYRRNLPADFYLLFDRVLADLDKANRQEALNQSGGHRQKLFLKDLSKKSLALGLGPLAIIASEGKKMTDRQARATLDFFRYALAAKQLSDDARDWQEDLEAGKITVANAPIDKALKQLKKNSKPVDDNLRINLLFAQKAAPKLINNIGRLTKLARYEIKKAGLAESNPLADSILSPLETGVEEAGSFLRLLRQTH